VALGCDHLALLGSEPFNAHEESLHSKNRPVGFSMLHHSLKSR
jgi:hypothetical protein